MAILIILLVYFISFLANGKLTSTNFVHQDRVILQLLQHKSYARPSVAPEFVHQVRASSSCNITTNREREREREREQESRAAVSCSWIRASSLCNTTTTIAQESRAAVSCSCEA